MPIKDIGPRYDFIPKINHLEFTTKMDSIEACELRKRYGPVTGN
jgi:hypothetical protein